MKKILDYCCYVSLEGNYYYNTSLKYHLTYAEPQMEKVLILLTFDDLVRAVKNGEIMNAEIMHTPFRRKPMVRLSLDWDSHYVTERNFKPIYVKKVWEELKEQRTLSTLMEYLPAEDFLEFIKDRGISCVTIK